MNWIICSDIIKCTIFLWSLLTCLLFTIFQIYVYTYTCLFIFGALILGIQYFRNAQPPKSCVRAILGRDPNEPAATDDDSNFTIHTVAHRGMGLDAPENTIASFKYSLDRGVKMIELDVSLTKDDVPIIFHDYDLSRLTGQKTIVKETKWAELRKIDIAAKHPLRDRFPNSRIATLDETLDFCLQNNLKLILDLKSDDFKIIQILIDQFKKRDMYHSVMVSGFNPLTLYKLRRADPNIVCSMAIRRFDYPYAVPNNAIVDNRYRMLYKRYLWMTGDCLWWMCHPWIANFIGISSILLNREAICTAAVNYWRARNVRLMAWTVNHPAEKLYYVKCLKTTYLTDTFIGETSAYNNNDPTMNSDVISPTVAAKDMSRLTRDDKRLPKTENGKIELNAQ